MKLNYKSEVWTRSQGTALLWTKPTQRPKSDNVGSETTASQQTTNNNDIIFTFLFCKSIVVMEWAREKFELGKMQQSSMKAEIDVYWENYIIIIFLGFRLLLFFIYKYLHFCFLQFFLMVSTLLVKQLIEYPHKKMALKRCSETIAKNYFQFLICKRAFVYVKALKLYARELTQILFFWLQNHRHVSCGRRLTYICVQTKSTLLNNTTLPCFYSMPGVGTDLEIISIISQAVS